MYKCELCPKMYILQGAYKTHLKTEHDIGIWKVPSTPKPSTKKTKTTKPEVTCQYCSKKYTSANLLEKHITVHGKCCFFVVVFCFDELDGHLKKLKLISFEKTNVKDVFLHNSVTISCQKFLGKIVAI